MEDNRLSGWRPKIGLWRLGAAELAMFLPVWLIVAIYMVPSAVERVVWLLTLPILTLCGVLLSFRMTKLWVRWLTAILPGLLHMLLFYDTVWHAVVLFAAAWTVVVRGMAVSSPQSRAKVIARYSAGLLLYFIGYIVVSRLDEWTPYIPLFTAGGILCIIIALFTVNDRLLRQESFSADDRTVSAVPGLRRHNRWFVAGTAAGAMLVAAAASGFLGHWMLVIVRALLRALLPSEQAPEPEKEPSPAPAPPMLQAAPEEKGWFAQLLDILFYVIGAAAVCVLAFLLLRAAYRNRRIIAGLLGRVWRRLAAFLGRTHRPEAGTGYVDEETTIFSWETVQRALTDKWLKRFGRAERWSELGDNRERVRFLYREWLRGLGKRGYTVRSSLTPEETRVDAQRSMQTAAGAEGLIGLYYKARYGRTDITDAEVKKAAESHYK